MSTATGFIWAIGRLLGLSTTAGVRAWTTLFVVGLLSREQWGFQVPDRFSWLESIPVLLIFLILGIVEIAIDKVPAYDRLHARLALPERLAAGAIVGACALGHGWIGTLVGAAAGASLAFFGFKTWRAWRPRSSPNASSIPLLSLVEDLAAAVAAFLSAVLPPAGYAVFGWLAWLRMQLHGRRAAKYRALSTGATVSVATVHSAVAPAATEGRRPASGESAASGRSTASDEPVAPQSSDDPLEGD